MSSKSLGTLTLDLVAKVGGFVSGMEKAERTAKRSARSASDSYRNASKEISQSNDQIVKSVRSAAGAIGAAFTVSKIVGYTEAYTTMSNRLLLVTEGTREFAEAQKSIIDIAQNNRQGLSETAELYQRIATNQKELGISSKEIAGLVDTISKSMVVSGASAQSASAALVQLGQAFASGVLRGEELNSVMEQAPALAKAIADGLGVPIGALREMGKAGELSAKSVIDALQSQASAVDESFSKMNATLSQSWQVAGNSLTVIVGELDKMTGASSSVASAIIGISGAIEDIAKNEAALSAVADVVAVVGIAIAARLTAPVLANAAAFVLAQREAVRYQMTLAAMAGVSTRTAAALGTMAVAARAGAAALALVGGPVGAAILAASAIAYFATSSNSASKSAKDLAENVDYLNDSFSGFTKFQAIEAINSINDKIGNLQIESMVAADAVSHLERQLELYPDSSKVSEWSRALDKSRSELDGNNKEIGLLNSRLLELKSIIEKIDLDGSASDASKAYSDLSSKINEQILMHGKSTEAAKIQAQIQGGLITGLLDGEAEKLIALAKTRDAQIEAAEADKKRAQEAKKIADSISNEISAIERAAKVWGMSADEIKIYDLQISGATKSQIEHAQSLLKSVGALEKKREAEDNYKSLVESLRTEEEKRSDTLREQMDILREYGDISEEQRKKLEGLIAAQALDTEINLSLGTDAVGLVEAEEKLAEWYANQLEALAKYREERSDLNEQWDRQEAKIRSEHEEQLTAINAQWEAARREQMQEGFSTILSVAEKYYQGMEGEQAAYTRAALQLGQILMDSKKREGLQSILISTHTAAMGAYQALASLPVIGPALGAAAAATIYVAGGAAAAKVTGMAHDGIDSVPKTGTWILEKGERVTTERTSARLDKTLDAVQNQMQTGSGVVVNIHNAAPGARVEESQGADGRPQIDVWLADFVSDGRTTRAIQQKFNLPAYGK